MGLDTYMCTRHLKNVPFKTGDLFHQYICTGNANDGYSCSGLVPSGSMFDSPGKIESEKYKQESCEKIQDQNSCVEQCIKDQFNGPLPNYSFNLKHGENCQTFANSTVSYCQVKCAGSRWWFKNSEFGQLCGLSLRCLSRPFHLLVVINLSWLDGYFWSGPFLLEWFGGSSFMIMYIRWSIYPRRQCRLWVSCSQLQ